MKTIKKLVPKSLAKLFGLMYAICGFFFGLIMLVISLFSQTEGFGLMGIVFGIAAPIFLTIFYGLMGWVGGYILGWIYNFLAKRVGGIQVEVE